MAQHKDDPTFRSFYELPKDDEPSTNDKGTKKSVSEQLTFIQSNVIGAFEPFETPFGKRKMVYADWIASARAYGPIENYVRDEVLPNYANTHTSTSITGLQSTSFRHEARQIIQQAVNANTIKDVVLFTGSGSTSAINKFVNVLGLNRKRDVDEKNRPIVFVGPFEHHSNLLPWRESCADVVEIPETPQGNLDVEVLQSMLTKYSNRCLKIGSFSACSNVTGIITNVDQVTVLLHKNGALACWDYACGGPYLEMDMNPVRDASEPDRAFLHKDAIFLSPHKFLGGINTPGLLIAKKTIFSNAVPSAPNLGGGTVFYVKSNSQRYLSNRVEREEGGTPDVVGAIRAGLTFQLKETVGAKNISAIEDTMWRKASEKLASHPNIELLGYSDEAKQHKHVAIFSFLIRHGTNSSCFLHYNFVSALLNDLYGIQTRGGCMCAGPYAQRLLGMDEATQTAFENELAYAEQYCEYLRPGFTRFSFPYFMSEKVCDFIIQAVHDIASDGWRLLPEYRFKPKTGEWQHKTRFTKFPGRKWLTHIDLFSNTPNQSNAPSDTNPDNELQSILSNAKGIMLKADGQKTERLGDQTLLFSDSASKLRWFVMPSEAQQELLKAKQDAQHTTKKNEELEHKPIQPEKYFERLSQRVLGDLPKPMQIGSTTPTAVSTTPTEASTLKANHEASKNTTKTENKTTNGECKKSKNGEICADGECFLPRKKDKYPLRSSDGTSNVSQTTDSDKLMNKSHMEKAKLFPNIPKKIMRGVGKAILAFDMIKEGDRLMLGLSGGKDSLCLLHVLLRLQKISPVKFELGACTIDPGTSAFDPSPLIPYMKSLGVEYHYVRQNIFQDASSGSLQGTSICSFCARMKRGALYNTARENKYNVLVLAQHLDDFAESWLMSAFYNAQMRTMKANYTEKKGEIRIIRPLAYVREFEMKKFSYEAKLPVINENCPACFEAPQERKRIKKLLAKEEAVKPQIFHSLRRALVPLMDEKTQMMCHDELLKRENTSKQPSKKAGIKRKEKGGSSNDNKKPKVEAKKIDQQR